MTGPDLIAGAAEAVARGRQYGNLHEAFGRHARMWTEWLEGRGWSNVNGLPLDSTDVAAMMVLFKMGRLAGDPSHEDSLVDVVGYAACWADLADTLLKNCP